MIHKEELLTIINEYDNDKLDSYILQLELRIEDTRNLLKEIRTIRKRRSRKTTHDNGPRGGM